MIDSKKLSEIKGCCVAIGLVEAKEKSTKPLAILGSGFFVNSEGFVMSAAHVFTKCKEEHENFFKREIKTTVAAFHVKLKSNGFDFDFRVLPMGEVKVQKMEEKKSESNTFDIGIGVPKDYGKSIPHLKIKKFSNSILYNDVLMCGYPSGNLSLNDGENSLRLSPTIQFGRVTGLMPIDTYHTPWALQSDVVGTGGSSGSPLIDPTDGCVIGIAQKVLPTAIDGNFIGFIRGLDPKSVTGNFGVAAKIGLVYGNTSHYFFDLHEKVKEAHEKSIVDFKYTIPTVNAELVKMKTGPLEF